RWPVGIGFRIGDSDIFKGRLLGKGIRRERVENIPRRAKPGDAGAAGIAREYPWRRSGCSVRITAVIDGYRIFPGGAAVGGRHHEDAMTVAEDDMEAARRVGSDHRVR